MLSLRISQQKAEMAQKAGWFKDEIVPVETTVKDKEKGQLKKVVVSEDDGFRYGTTAEGLGNVEAAFPKWPPSAPTGGNASQITDGAAALLLMQKSTAEKLGQKIVGRFAKCTGKCHIVDIYADSSYRIQEAERYQSSPWSHASWALVQRTPSRSFCQKSTCPKRRLTSSR